MNKEKLKNALNYDPCTGVFTWNKRPSNNMNKGDIAGCIGVKGYLKIKFEYKTLSAHRLAWLYVYGTYPSGEIDHINGIRSDNRICNLRDVTHRENMKNKKRCKTNKSGVTGVYFIAKTEFWQVYLGSKYIGIFKCLIDAAAARRSAELSCNYHINHGRG